ncbi:prenyltransferase-like protein [Xylogone sp. PMI_703]|nr:prenyltransferase-like protein [Xylogone sp. PMI_703]
MESQSPIKPFPTDLLLSDLEHITTSITAPYSRARIQEVFKTFSNNLSNGAIAIRTTDRPGDSVHFWAGELSRVDTISLAVDAGLVPPLHPTVLLLRSWFSMYDNEPQPSTDFDTAKGLVKTWIYFKTPRPIEQILSIEPVPESFRNHIDKFKQIGAHQVHFVAVTYGVTSVNIYFVMPSELSSDGITNIIRTLLPSCSPITAAEMEQIMKCMKPGIPTVLAVTLSYSSGTIERLCLYAFMVSRELVLSIQIGQRLEKFLKETPVYDEKDSINIGWSFGRKGERYMKMDVGYCGGFGNLMDTFKD